MMGIMPGVSPGAESFAAEEGIDYGCSAEAACDDSAQDYYVSVNEGVPTLKFREPAVIAEKPEIVTGDVATPARSSDAADPYVMLLSVETSLREAASVIKQNTGRFAEPFSARLLMPAFAGPQSVMPQAGVFAVSGSDETGGASGSDARTTDEEIRTTIRNAVQQRRDIDTELWPKFLERDMPGLVAEVRKKIAMIERAGLKTNAEVIAKSAAVAWVRQKTGPDAAYDRYVAAVREGKIGSGGSAPIPKHVFISRNAPFHMTPYTRFLYLEKMEMLFDAKAHVLTCVPEDGLVREKVMGIGVDCYLVLDSGRKLPPRSVMLADVVQKDEIAEARGYLDQFMMDERIVPASFRSGMSAEWLDRLAKEIAERWNNFSRDPRRSISEEREAFAKMYFRKKMYDLFAAEIDAAYRRYLDYIRSGRFGKNVPPLDDRNKFARIDASSTNAFDNLRDIEARGLWPLSHVRRPQYNKDETVLSINADGRLVLGFGQNRTKKMVSADNVVSPYDVRLMRFDHLPALCSGSNRRGGR